MPHLDYCLQKFGPDAPEIEPELEAIDQVVGDLIAFFRQRGVEPVVLSEYGISKVSRAIHLNREFRQRGCQAFAVADHQIAHVYINDASIAPEVRALLESCDGVEEVRVPREIWGEGVATERAGDLVSVAQEDAWFTYYFWEDDSKAPDYARCIDIHRKPGYDPVELFIDPELACPKLKIASFLLKKKLGFRALLDVIPLDASLVKGSHGRDKVPESEQPVWISRSDRVVRSAEEIAQAREWIAKLDVSFGDRVIKTYQIFEGLAERRNFFRQFQRSPRRFSPPNASHTSSTWILPAANDFIMDSFSSLRIRP